MKLKYIIYVLIAGASYGVLSTIVKLAYTEGYSLSDVAGTQAFFGAIILWLFYFIFYKKKERDLISKNNNEKYSVIKLLFTGAASGVINIAYYKCVSDVPASVAIILLMQFTWMSIVLERIFFKTKINLKQFLIIILILIGTIFAAGFFKKEKSFHLSLNGLLYGLLAALAYAIFLIANGKFGNNYTPLKKSAIISIGMCLMVFIFFPPSFLWNGALHGSLTKWGILLGIFGTVLPPILFSIAIPKIGISLSSILSSMELPAAIIMAYFILKEDVDFIQLIGTIIILLAIVLANIKKEKQFV